MLVYSGSRWDTEQEFHWLDTGNQTQVTALYPVYNNFTYTEENLYQNHALEDILYVREDYPARKNIHLLFKHLFSMLTLHLSVELQKDLQKLEITSPTIVSQIQPESAEITLDNNKCHTSSIQTPNPSGSYSFIIPPAENISISITVHTAGKQYTTRLATRSFIGNEQYQYSLKTSEKIPGITTAEEWIAFSQLFNHPASITEYQGKTLAEFGETVNGITTYRLLNDIDFNGTDCSHLEHIGNSLPGTPFSDTFDGQGHTIFNMEIPSHSGTTGLFGAIGSAGIIKNIHLNSCKKTLKKTPKSGSGTALLTGMNYGIINNCSVEKGTLNSSEQTTPTGGIVGHTYGTIINCHVKDITLKSKETSCGGIAGYSQGNIINCFSANNNITASSSNSGGISGRSNFELPTNIINCYIYNLKISKTKGGLFYGTANNSTITHCFYLHTSNSYASALTGSGKNNQTTGNFSYQPDFTYNSIPVYQLLNQWITETAPLLYPKLSFTHWKDGANSLPGLLMQE